MNIKAFVAKFRSKNNTKWFQYHISNVQQIHGGKKKEEQNISKKNRLNRIPQNAIVAGAKSEPWGLVAYE